LLPLKLPVIVVGAGVLQVPSEFLGPSSSGVLPLMQGTDQQPGQGARRERAQPASVISPIGIHNGRRRRQFRFGDMMVNHDDRQPQTGGVPERFERGDSAVQGHHQVHTGGMESVDGRGTRAVTLRDPIGDVDHRVRAHRPQESDQLRRRRCTVDVVVAEDPDPPFQDDGIGQQGNRMVKIEDGTPVGKLVGRSGMEPLAGLIGPDATADQKPGKPIGYARRASDRLDCLFIRGAILPDPPGQGPPRGCTSGIHRDGRMVDWRRSRRPPAANTRLSHATPSPERTGPPTSGPSVTPVTISNVPPEARSRRS